MKWWPMIGISKVLTENKKYATKTDVKRMKIFKRSLHIYTIDVGNSNILNFEMRALQTPKYNVHRFGMYFAASPRHADLLIVLGKPTKKMIAPLLEMVNQIPEPFGVMLLKGCESSGIDPDELKIPNVVTSVNGCLDPSEILAILLKISGRID